MDAATLGALLAERFGDRLQWTARSAKRLYAHLPLEDLVAAASFLRERLPGCRLGTATGIDLREGVGVYHHFVVNGSPLVVTLKVLAAKPDPRVPSLAPRIPAADWIEREIHDLLGVVFEGHPDARRLLTAESMADQRPLRRDFDVRQFKESIGELPRR